jgi:hypothetical protein
MKYIRIYSDAAGDSHFEDLEWSLAPVTYAPPAPPLDMSEPFAVTRAVLFSIPGGWFGEAHPAPRRQLYFATSGQLEVQVSDGEVRVFEAGDIGLVEDTQGQGHTTRALGTVAAAGAFVHLADQG